MLKPFFRHPHSWHFLLREKYAERLKPLGISDAYNNLSFLAAA